MTVPKASYLPADVHRYTTAHTTAPDDLSAELIARTAALFGDNAGMQSPPEQAALIGLLAALVRPRQAVEVGTFTGLAALAIARQLPADGRLLCLDISEEFTAIAREFWERAGVGERVELLIGPAAPALAALPTEPYLDLAFIDADKEGYSAYWSAIVPRMRANGLIIVDNVLWKGRVLDPPADEPPAVALAAFNEQVIADDRVDVIMLPLGDGLTLARKR